MGQTALNKENTGKVVFKLALLDYLQIFLRLLFFVQVYLFSIADFEEVLHISHHHFGIPDEKMYFNIIHAFNLHLR